MPRLTKRLCDAAKYRGDGKSRCIVWDEQVRGFGLRVYPTGRKSFVVWYLPDGARNKRMMVVGQYGEFTLVDARDKAQELLKSVRDGKDPIEERAQRQKDAKQEIEARTTFGQLADRWLEDYAKMHRKSWREDKRRIDTYIKPAIGSLLMADVAIGDLTRLHNKIGQNARIEANRVIFLTRTIFNKAIKWDLLPAEFASPANKLEPFKETSRERWLRPRELTRLAASIHREDDPWVRTAILLLILTGSRKTELLRARWDRVDLKGRRMLLEDTKTGDAKVVPLSRPAIDLLAELPRQLHSPWVFPGRSSKPDPDGKVRHQPLQDLKRPWERIRKRAKLTDVHIHDLRRTTGSWLVQRGVPLKVIGAALGHRDTRATEVYSRIAAEQPAEALDMLGEAMSGLVRPRAGRPDRRAARKPGQVF